MSAFMSFRRALRASPALVLALGVLGGTAAGFAVLPEAHAASAPGPDAPLTLKVLKVEGNKQIPTADILAAFPYHVGDTVTRNKLDEGLQQVMALYKQKNVGAKFGEKERFVGKTIQFYLTIEEMAPSAAAAPAPFVLDQVNFVGNKKVPTAELEAATKLRPGAQVTTEAVVADTQAIQSVYKKHNIGVQIQPNATQPHQDNHVVLTYTMTEKTGDN